MLDFDTLFRSPELHLAALDVRKRRAAFVQMSPADYRDPAFLYDESIVSRPRVELDLSALLDAHARRPHAGQPLHYIFHTAYCCSTLLARCLEAMGCFVLKEPPPLLELAFAHDHLVALDPEEPRAWLALVVDLMARTYAPQPVVVKCGALANVLAESLLDACRDARAVFLYGGLAHHLSQVLKDPERRKLARHRRALLVPRARSLGIEAGGDLSDAQAAAFVWLTRMRDHERAAKRLGDRILAVEGTRIADDPGGTMAAIASHFGIPRMAVPALGNVLDFHAKRPAERFVSEPADDRYAAEIARGLAWVEERGP